MLLWRAWRETRALAAGASRTDLRVCPHTTLLPHKKTGAHLREHRFNLHVMWSSQLARSHLHVVWSSDLRTLHPHVMWSLDPVRLREALDAVLGDARKE